MKNKDQHHLNLGSGVKYRFKTNCQLKQLVEFLNPPTSLREATRTKALFEKEGGI